VRRLLLIRCACVGHTFRTARVYCQRTSIIFRRPSGTLSISTVGWTSIHSSLSSTTWRSVGQIVSISRGSALSFCMQLCIWRIIWKGSHRDGKCE